jgi:hypothetical protein
VRRWRLREQFLLDRCVALAHCAAPVCHPKLRLVFIGPS